MNRKLKTLNIRDVKHLARHLGTSPKELDAICAIIQGQPGRFYREFDRVKNGKTRHMAEPLGRLRQLLDRLNNLLQRVELPASIHGGVKGRSPATNSMPHVKKPMLMKFDVKDFFPSISPLMVYKMFAEQMGCRAAVASRLKRLVTLHGCVPHGSPTSTAVANLVIAPLVRRLEGLASQHGADYSQFVDDGALSGPAHLQDLIPLVKRIIRQAMFRPKESKTYCVDAGKEQVVTGYRVNHQLDVCHEKLNEVRGLVDGLCEDMVRGQTPDHKRLTSIEGKVRYVTRCNRGAGRHLRRRYAGLVAAQAVRGDLLRLK